MNIASCCAPGTRLLIGVSGGVDSVALAILLQEQAPQHNWKIGIVHVNHGLRGTAARADETIVRRFAKERGLAFHLHRVDVPALARSRHLSIEMAARDARYACFAKTLRRHRYDVVAVAHTADDQAETVLLRLLRGTTSTGLGGMAPNAVLFGIPVIRPLLGVPKSSLRRELEKRGIGWREDASNTDTSFLRNRVRHELIPLLEDRFNPNIRAALTRLATVLREEEAVWDAWTAEAMRRCVCGEGLLIVPALRTESVAFKRRMVRTWLAAEGIEPEHITFDIIEAVVRLSRSSSGSKTVTLGEGVSVKRAYDRIALQRVREGDTAVRPRVRVCRRGERLLPQWGLRVCTRTTAGYPGVKGCAPKADMPMEAFISIKAIEKAPLFLRPWKKGDRFTPLGCAGSRKVQDIFVDRKIPAAARAAVPLLECRGQIIWIPGYTIAESVRVQSDNEPALYIRLEKLNRGLINLRS